MKSFLRFFDIYAEPINFTYKNKRSYRTVLGGLITLISVMAVFAYFGTLLAKMFARENVIT